MPDHLQGENERKVCNKLSLLLNSNHPPHKDAARSEEIATAQDLLETHGRRAGQVLVDEVQAAVRAGDGRRIAFLERVCVAMTAIDDA